jgi:ABC-type transport system substrate-binding protein
MPLLRDIKSQVADAICTVTIDDGARNLIINPARPPFDNPELRRALSLTLDRKAFVDILVDGQGLVGGVMHEETKLRRLHHPRHPRTVPLCIPREDRELVTNARCADVDVKV